MMLNVSPRYTLFAAAAQISEQCRVQSFNELDNFYNSYIIAYDSWPSVNDFVYFIEESIRQDTKLINYPDNMSVSSENDSIESNSDINDINDIGKHIDCGPWCRYYPYCHNVDFICGRSYPVQWNKHGKTTQFAKCGSFDRCHICKGGNYYFKTCDSRSFSAYTPVNRNK